MLAKVKADKFSINFKWAKYQTSEKLSTAYAIDMDGQKCPIKVAAWQTNHSKSFIRLHAIYSEVEQLHYVCRGYARDLLNNIRTDWFGDALLTPVNNTNQELPDKSLIVHNLRSLFQLWLDNFMNHSKLVTKSPHKSIYTNPGIPCSILWKVKGGHQKIMKPSTLQAARPASHLSITHVGTINVNNIEFKGRVRSTDCDLPTSFLYLLWYLY